MRQFISASALAGCVAIAVVVSACKADDGAGSRRVAATTSATPSVSNSVNSPSSAATPHPTSTPADGVRRVTITEARAALEAGRAFFVDVRGVDAHRERRIKGAVAMTGEEVAARVKELPRDKLIITYCA